MNILKTTPGQNNPLSALRQIWRQFGESLGGSQTPSFPGSSPATSPEVLSLSNFSAIQRFPGSFPDFPFHGSIPSKWTRRVWVANCCRPPLPTLTTPEKQTVGTVTASHKMLTLQALSSSLNAGTAKRGCLSRGKVFESPPAVCPPERPRPFARYRTDLPGSVLDFPGRQPLSLGPEPGKTDTLS